MGRVSTGLRTHAASRAASVVLGLTLLAVCVTALIASFELNRATQTAEAAVRASDLYQQARYYSVAESDALGSYLLTQAPALCATSTRRSPAGSTTRSRCCSGPRRRRRTTSRPR